MVTPSQLASDPALAENENEYSKKTESSPAKQNTISKQKTITEIPANMSQFTTGKDSFKFGVLGLFNTRRDRSFYKVVAHIGGGKF